VIVVTTNAASAEMIGVMIDVARTTTTATTTTARNGPHRHHLKGQPYWFVSISQSRDQLHRRRSPSDLKQ
jgi:hypothetical protein